MILEKDKDPKEKEKPSPDIKTIKNRKLMKSQKPKKNKRKPSKHGQIFPCKFKKFTKQQIKPVKLYKIFEDPAA